MERPPVNLRFDVATGTLAIETGGPSISVEELGRLAAVTRTDEDDEERVALFVSPSEADVLLKMVAYILDKVKVTEGSRAALEAVKPRLESLRDG
ncbi:MAG TPA: hypothetical protein VGP33_01705 [Chloroflexota bacterium]|jgi:hypothetical protein|nr:hypothetical protein [Chloroflexota bacterium]